MNNAIKIAIMGGGEEELSLLSEFHRTPGINIVGLYDRDPRAVAMDIAEIIGIPKFSDDLFLEKFRDADYIIVTEKRKLYEREIDLLRSEGKKIVNPTEAVTYLSAPPPGEEKPEQPPWPAHLEEALHYINRITDRERLLKWLLEISVRAVQASSGSIMLYSEKTGELYIGYAIGLSAEVVKKTRQKLGEGVAGNVARSNKVRLIKEIVETPLYKEGRERQEIQSAVSAPLSYKERLLGVLNISTNRGEKKLDEEDMEIIELLASKISPILEQHLRIDTHEVRELEFQTRRYLETFFNNKLGFHEKFTMLCRFLSEKLGADTVVIYTATDEGDWLILGGSDQQIPQRTQSPRLHCYKGTIARAYLNSKEIIMTEASNDPTLKLKLEKGAITSIYLPLIHNEVQGVMVVEFSELEALERFFKVKDSISFQVSFYTYSQLKELKQTRRMQSLEELSSMPPKLMGIKDLPGRAKSLASLLSSLIKAERGSFHFVSPEYEDSVYHNFPEDEGERKARIEKDSEILDNAVSQWKPMCTSYLNVDIDISGKLPLYMSIISYPVLHSEEISAVYIGYNKTPASPLDSSIFGENELEIMKKAGEVLAPLFIEREPEAAEGAPETFENLLKSNQKAMLERIKNEIERADRYHHSFTITLFKINGLRDLFKTNYQSALRLINELSLGVRRRVRKTDYFSWIELDLFGVLSLESYHRLGYLEGRINEFIGGVLKQNSICALGSFYPESSFAVFPGKSETSAELVNEAKSKLQT